MRKTTMICLALAASLAACKSTHDGELGPETPTPLLAPVFGGGDRDAAEPDEHTHTHFLAERSLETLIAR